MTRSNINASPSPPILSVEEANKMANVLPHTEPMEHATNADSADMATSNKYVIRGVSTEQVQHATMVCLHSLTEYLDVISLSTYELKAYLCTLSMVSDTDGFLRSWNFTYMRWKRDVSSRRPSPRRERTWWRIRETICCLPGHQVQRSPI